MTQTPTRITPSRSPSRMTRRPALQAMARWAGVTALGLGALGMAGAAAQMAWHYRQIRTRTREGCFVAFSKSHWIGASMFAGVALGFALR